MAVVFLCPFVGCGGGGDSGTTVNIAAKDFTEQYIIGEMLAALVSENTDLEVNLTSGITGETTIIMPAMEKGDFDFYAEYDSTAWLTVLKEGAITDVEQMHIDLNEAYNDLYDMTWLGYYGFDNGYEIAVRTETAKAYGLKTLSDLVAVSDKMIFGAGYEFYEREDGYDGLQSMYHFNFKEKKEMNLSLKYDALLDGQVDAITVYKTDGRLNYPEIVILEDDKGYFPPAMCGTIIRNEIAEAHPELVEVLNKLNGVVSSEEMREMNAAVDINGEDPKDVATAFLQRKGLIDQ
ncbi:MAG TPA: glycine betaine ABC transporter substrate-binding protein [Clostridiales bacterium]|nr:glycine betaine ABC transporter substrate-binding protein [Clostridiales bacterium]